MAAVAATLPIPIRLLNGSLAMLGGVGRRLVDLNPDRLMQRAAKETGLEDYGCGYFREPLRRLCQSLEEDAHLSGLGRVIARKDILRLLGNRLQFVEIFKQHPEIADEQITAPVFILGMPRTGTTSLHELMALDPQFRIALSWEVAHPFPPPETATYTSDPRIARVNDELSGVDRLLPGFKNMHPMGAELPQECVSLFAHDFASMIFDVQFRLNQYQEWLLREDMGEVFSNHRRWLQLLQWKCPGDTWVLKSPQYLWNIDDMLREYPDARVVQTHRDPVKVALSIGSLTATLRSLGSSQVDLIECTREYLDLLDYGTGKTMAAREKGLLNSDRVIDVQFAGFRKDPLAALERIYVGLGFSMTETTRERMREFLRSGNESERHGKHSYDLAGSGLDLEQERIRFKNYEEAYGIPREISG